MYSCTYTIYLHAKLKKDVSIFGIFIALSANICDVFFTCNFWEFYTSYNFIPRLVSVHILNRYAFWNQGKPRYPLSPRDKYITGQSVDVKYRN